MSVAHQTHPPPAPCRRSIFLAAPLRLGPQRRSSSARRRLPLDGVQRRRGSPSLGGGVGGSPSLLSPVASRLRLRPPRTGRRPCVRNSLSPSRLCCNVGARPAAQGGRALAPPVAVGALDPLFCLIKNRGAKTFALYYKRSRLFSWKDWGFILIGHEL